ncbi:hypothetical protein [Corynebacterium gerontici]|uniref:Chromosome partition protein Smc n=1 Tax=Corynebacterium gerontici TaxID=2079234 RepID=A0A3G6J2Y2_9CORY|nr:hypothetical protein [Corynebacterium gerontici]AZA12299.1 Chromosome partition protein Smc [Corynebacterium gerontici]
MSPNSQPPSATKRVIAGMLLAAPLVIGAGAIAASNTHIPNTWNTTGEDLGAPSGDVDLSNLRRALGDANMEASLLKAGTSQLVSGTGKLKGGSEELSNKMQEARKGSQELAEGMVQIQAGTAQLGEGASKVAEGVDFAVKQIVGLEAARGQILTAIEDAQRDAEQSQDPKAAELKQRLEEFHRQVETAQIDAGTKAQLEELRSGSREVANQLNAPGYGYRDGIYSATKGSKDLASGLGQLSQGVEEAKGGITQLDDGAKQIDAMAQDTRNNLAAARKALPSIAPGTPEAIDAGITKSLAPLLAFMVAAGVMLAAGAAKRDKMLSIVSVAGLAVLGGVLVAILGVGTGPVEVLAAGVISAAAAAMALLGTTLLVRLLGARIGGICAVLGLVLQTAVVGWVWNSASTQGISKPQEVLSALMPLHYPTMALSAVGNGVSGASLWLAAGVMGCVLLFVTGIARWLPAGARGAQGNVSEVRE